MEKRRINVRAIVWRDGKLLAVKHNDHGAESKVWFVPGGGLDPHESLQDGVRREIMEETGVKAHVGKLLFIQQFESRRADFKEELEFFFHVENHEDFTDINLANTSHGLAEIARIEFIDPTEVDILPKMLGELPIADYIATDKPVHVANLFKE